SRSHHAGYPPYFVALRRYPIRRDGRRTVLEGHTNLTSWLVCDQPCARTSSPKEVGCHSMADSLSPTMTLREFENGYWYLDQLKNFAERIGIPSANKLRKDELEKAIVAFLRTGRAALPTKRSLRKSGVKDVERGLNLKLRIENYTSNRETKDFIVEQAHRMAPEVREKSGVWYRLNRWREEQITSGQHPSYGDLVRQYRARTPMQRQDKGRLHHRPRLNPDPAGDRSGLFGHVLRNLDETALSVVLLSYKFGWPRGAETLCLPRPHSSVRCFIAAAKRV